MKVRLIKRQEEVKQPIPTSSVTGRQRARAKTRAAVFNWVQDYQQKKAINPREQFAELFKVAA